MAKSKRNPSDAELLEHAFALFAEQGYGRTSLSDVATRAGVQLAIVRDVAPDKLGLIDAMIRVVDRNVLGEDAGFTEDESVRDRLFDLLMRRFDGYQPYRAGLVNASSELARDPLAGIYLLTSLGRAMAIYLDEAGAGVRGPLGIVRIKVLSAIWLRCLKVYFADETEDLSKTMSVLDKALAQAERAAGWFGPGRRSRSENDVAEPWDVSESPAGDPSPR